MAISGIKINRATRDVIERKAYPNLTGAPIPGFEFGGTGPEEWLIVLEDNYGGTYDQRYYMLEISEDELADRIEHPSYPGVGQWVIHRRLVKQDIDSILINLENAEYNANEQIIPTTKFNKIIAVAFRGLARKVNANITPTDEELAAIKYLIRAGLKIEQNYITRHSKQEIIDSEPDMDSDWVTTPEPEEEP